MKKVVSLIAGVVMAMSLAPAASAGPSCENFGSVCDEIVHRPLQKLCSSYELDCNG